MHTKNPITMTMLTIVVIFILSTAILALTRPSWVKVKGSPGKTNWTVLYSYSLTFALVCAIAAMLVSSKYRGHINSKPTYGDSKY